MGCRWRLADCLLLWDSLCNQRLRTASRASCQLTGPLGCVCSGCPPPQPATQPALQPQLTRASLTPEVPEPQHWGWRDRGGSLLQRDAGGLQTRSLPPELHPLRGTPLALAWASSSVNQAQGWGVPGARVRKGRAARLCVTEVQPRWLRRPGVGAGSARGRTAPRAGRQSGAAAAAAGGWQRGRVRAGRRRRLEYLRMGQ